MCDPVTAGLMAATTALGIYQGQQQIRQEKSAQQQTQQNADKQAQQAEQNINRANQKSPNTPAILSQQEQTAKAGGGGSASLTGPQGVQTAPTLLGRQTLLGA